MTKHPERHCQQKIGQTPNQKLERKTGKTQKTYQTQKIGGICLATVRLPTHRPAVCDWAPCEPTERPSNPNLVGARPCQAI